MSGDHPGAAMTAPSPQQEPSSEPSWITIYNGSDRVWKLISMYEVQELGYAINEDEPGHLKELHDSGNEILKRIRSRTVVSSRSHSSHQSEQEIREKVLELLNDFRRYANGEFKEADLSDNERETRIHLEYENKIWGIMQELRSKQGEP
jgi:hypothetical protein